MKPFVSITPPSSYPFPAARSFLPIREDRVQRFSVGDRVRVVRGGTEPCEATVVEVRADPHPKEYLHCSGKSARYLLDSIALADTWVYDWMLEAAPVPPRKPLPLLVRGAIWLVVWAAFATFFAAVVLFLKILF